MRKQLSRKIPVSVVRSAKASGETFWVDGVGRELTEVRAKKVGAEVYLVDIPRNARRLVHNHDKYKGLPSDVLPSASDLLGLSQVLLATDSDLRNYHIYCRKGKTPIGRTTLRIHGKQLIKVLSNPALRALYPNPLAYFEAVIREYQSFQKRFDSTEKTLETVRFAQNWLWEKLGLQMKQTPNTAQEYTLKNGIFVKTNH
jgi:hypothetical protein